LDWNVFTTYKVLVDKLMLLSSGCFCIFHFYPLMFEPIFNSSVLIPIHGIVRRCHHLRVGTL
jgi:hypothetical protein